jgi:glycosyltransferase involved in cell wall biosynthesis
MPTFDVLMPVLNTVRFLGQAIDSIRTQTFSDWRLLILDHGSRDGSFELAQRYADLDNRIKVFSFAEADGLAELLNIGLGLCDCELILRLDADDVSLPNRMTIVNDLFHANPEALVIASHVLVIDETGRQIEFRRFPTSSTAVTAAGFFYNPISHSAVSINFKEFERHGARYGKDILQLLPATQSLAIRRHAEDYFLFGQLALLGPCINADAPLIKYRRHGASVGALHASTQMDIALEISRFLARTFCAMKGVQSFDPGPFCNHGDYIFDCQRTDYTAEYEQMAAALRHGLGPSEDLERELAFRWVLATRNYGRISARFLNFNWTHAATPHERRTVRQWLLRGVRNGKYVYRVNNQAAKNASISA